MVIMEDSKKSIKRTKLCYPVELEDRIAAIGVLVIAFSLIVIASLIAAEVIDSDKLLQPCGLKAATGWPCPGCGMTTAGKAFFKGHFLKAFFIQPAGAFFCIALIFALIDGAIVAFFGVQIAWIPPIRIWNYTKLLIFLLIVIAGGFAFTVIRMIL